MLSQAAFNAFLKTLEEPPAHAIFILATTEKHKIIPTILSRCQIFDFKRIQVSDMVSHLANIALKEGVTAEEEALHVIAEKADGALRDALSTFDRLVTFSGNNVTYKDAIENLNILDHDYYFRATDLVLGGDIPNSMLLFNEVLDFGFSGHDFINGLASHFRNLLMCKDSSTVRLLEVSEKIQRKYLEQSLVCAPLNLLKGLRAMNECDVQYRSSKNQRLTIELTIMRLCALHRSPEGTAEAAPQKKKQLAEAGTVPTSESSSVQNPIIVPEPPAMASVETSTLVEKNEETIQAEAQDAIEAEGPGPAQPVASKPAAETLPERPAIRSSRTGTVRINGAHHKLVEETVDLDSMPKDEFDEAHLQHIWQTRVNLLFKEKPSLLSSLTKHKPLLKKDNTIELRLDGKHQLEQLQETRALLIDAIRKDLNNYSVQLETPVENVIETKKAYTPKEIYQSLVEQNPELENLRKALDLDLDY
jgi:DNA polymerase-3 subunit gamma/tau